MKLVISNRLIATLRAEYPGCLADSDSAAQMIESITWQWILAVGRARQTIAEHTPVPDSQLAPEPSASR